MDDFVERAKAENPIEDVVAESYPLAKMRGRYLRATQHDSLVVDTVKQTFHWNSRGPEWQGDVICWLQREKGWDFKAAVEALCRRAGIATPNWGAVDEGSLMRSRLLQDVFEVAANEFHRWLLGDDERGMVGDDEARSYCCGVDYVRADGVRGRGRCWSVETVKTARLGFSGRKTPAQIKSMKGEFSLFGIDPECPQAVAVLGYHGDVAGWAKAQNIQVSEKWLEWGHVPGLMDKPRLIYVHEFGGRVRYLSARNLPGYDTVTDRESGKVMARKSFNPPIELVGERQPYINFVYRRDAEMVAVIEGQGDAVTLGQMGIAAGALCGVSAEDDGMRGLVRLLSKQAVYLGLDGDAAGKSKLPKVAALFGPMTRVIEWPVEPGESLEVVEAEQANV